MKKFFSLASLFALGFFLPLSADRPEPPPGLIPKTLLNDLPPPADQRDLLEQALGIQVPNMEEHAHNGPRLSLEDALLYTLANQWSVEVADLTVIQQCGRAEAAAGPFDPNIQGSANRVIRNDIQNTGIRSNFGSNGSDASLGISKKARLGTQVGFNASSGHSNDETSLPSRRGASRLSFTLDQPLLRDFIYGSDAMNEQAAIDRLCASKAQRVFDISNVLLSTINAYWGMVAAQENLLIQRASEERSKILVSYTQQLIDAQQLAKGEIIQPQAQLTRTVSSVLLSRQEIFQDTQTLLLQMGRTDFANSWDGRRYDLDTFPKVPTDAPDMQNAIEKLVEIALDRRMDLKAFHLSVEALRALVCAAENSLYPSLNVTGRLDLINTTAGPDAHPFLGSMDLHQPQKDLSVGLNLSVPLYNCNARGQLVTAQAALKSAEVQEFQLRETIISNTISAGIALFSLMIECNNADEEVKQFQEQLKQESQKFRAGLSTLFQLIDYENQLTSSLSRRVRTYERYNLALAQLRFVTGTLIDGGEEDCHLEIPQSVFTGLLPK